MSDNFERENNFESEKLENEFQSNSEQNVAESSSDFVSSDVNDGETIENEKNEASYVWNSNSENSKKENTEYHYSYVNGQNKDADHNPNNYDNAEPQQNPYQQTNSQTNYGYSSQQYVNQNPYGGQNNPYGGYAQQNPYAYQQNGYNGQQYSGVPYQQQVKKDKKPKVKKEKKPSKPVTRRALAAVLAVTVLASAALGFGGGYLASRRSSSSTNGSININQVTSTSGNSDSETITAGTTSAVVKKTADSVVEIATESVVTGQFAQQYVQTGAGSGVIISSDGYIVTNHHVIEGANNVTVKLRDGNNSYTAVVIGSDEDNDVALLKIDPKDTELTPATFGNSSELAVGDYVVAIGNPLGELGGTVTDGIISALAREITIDDKNMTLLQTNAQINPGNSGGGLFNADGNLVGIVNAKESGTEIEGIGFAIPINNVLDIINDLKSYGYVTGKIDLGMQLTDVSSNESAFFYGVSKTGCYVISVVKGSNADEAGFHTGDLITKVNGTEVSTSADVKSALKDSKVGDKVKFTVYRSGQTSEIELTLDEYVPTNSSNTTGQSNSTEQYEYNDNSFWSQFFGY